jgi:hypothetical protein
VSLAHLFLLVALTLLLFCLPLRLLLLLFLMLDGRLCMSVTLLRYHLDLSVARPSVYRAHTTAADSDAACFIMQRLQPHLQPLHVHLRRRGAQEQPPVPQLREEGGAVNGEV